MNFRFFAQYVSRINVRISIVTYRSIIFAYLSHLNFRIATVCDISFRWKCNASFRCTILREMRYIFSIFNRKDIFSSHRGNFIFSLAPLRVELKKLFTEWQPMLPVAWRGVKENSSLIPSSSSSSSWKSFAFAEIFSQAISPSLRVFIRTMIHFDTAAILDPNNPSDLFP